MRRHGWQLPYHPLQVVAIAVFSALVFAFYVFFAPFVGSKLLEIAVTLLYSPTVIVVFALYVWCVAVDPADNGLVHLKKCGSPVCSRSRAASSIVSSKADGKDIEMCTGPRVDGCSTLDEAPADETNPCWAHTLCALTFSPFYKSNAKVPPNEADMLYCNLCKVEISMDSKHCRVCDKCIDGFDHHCRWLNNCVGRKNYKDFVALMVSGIAMLILQWSVGLWVLVHCFLRLKYYQDVINSKLGSSFSLAAYISVVAVCTILAMAATYPLTQLFFFHILLIRKGIGTYDYIVAMREQDQKGIIDTAQSFATSPTSSIGTTPSAIISAGTLQGRAWCTPPRLFLDHEQGIYPPERSFSVKKEASSGPPSSKLEYERKKPVKLNPWALAALNKDDVLRAASVAKMQSSILRPVKAKNEKTIHESSDSMSSPGDVSTDFASRLAMNDSSQRGAEATRNGASQFSTASFMDREAFSVSAFDGSGSDSGDIIQLARRARKMLNPLQMEAMNAFKSSHAFSGTTVSSSPDSSGASSEPPVSPANRAHVLGIPHSLELVTDWKYKAAQGSETAEESDGDVSSPCTSIRKVVFAKQKGGGRF